MLIAYRKPEWDWTRDMERAVCTISPTNGSLVASPPQPQPPDPNILFSFQWIDQVFVPMNTMNPRGGGGPRYNDRDAGRGAPLAPPPRASQAPPPVNDYYTGDKPGFIVGCLTPMMNECFSRNLFGLPANRKNDAQKAIVTGTPLFLQDLQTGLLYGLFEATGPPLYNHVPNAWTGKNDNSVSTPCPVQIQFRIILNGPPIPAPDPEVHLSEFLLVFSR